MKQILIATHGKMASGIRYTAELIVGRSAEITTIDAYVNPEDDVEEQFRKYFQAHQNDRIFVFTDLQGGSVNQKLMAYAENDRVMLITGTNLAILIQVMLADENLTRRELEIYIQDARQELRLMNAEKELEKKPEKAAEKELEILEQPENPRSEPVSREQPVQNTESHATISALRIDDRLIHGQVAMTWTRQLKVKGILVANDDAANDNTQKMALKMAVPAGIKVLIKPVEEAIRVLNHPKASQMRILVLTRSVKDALRIRRQVGEIEFLNLGNTGRFDGIDVSQKTVLTSTIMLTDEEKECLKELARLDPKLCMQQVPNEEKKYVTDILDKLETGK